MKKTLATILIFFMLANLNVLAICEHERIVNTLESKNTFVEALDVTVRECENIGIESNLFISLLLCLLITIKTVLQQRKVSRRPKKKRFTPQQMITYIERLTRAPNQCA